MPLHVDMIRRQLATQPLSAGQLIEKICISQPTLSRALRLLGEDVIRIGAGRAIHYALRDTRRGLPDIPVYRVDTAGQLVLLGTLLPVCPDGFVMHQIESPPRYSVGLPWWLLDTCPQGYLGRAYAARHGTTLGLPARLTDWSDTHTVRALLAHGHDVVGNLLLGDGAREQFLTMPAPIPIPIDQNGQSVCPAGPSRRRCCTTLGFWHIDRQHRYAQRQSVVYYRAGPPVSTGTSLRYDPDGVCTAP